VATYIVLYRFTEPGAEGGNPMESLCRKCCVSVVLAFSLALPFTMWGCSGSSAPSPSPQPQATATKDAATLATDAYIWGLPFVVTMRTMQSLAPAIGINHLYAQAQLSDASSRTIVAPNVDTLYEVAILDLRDGPYVLTVPEIHDRYYTFQFLAMNTESFAYIGTRATGGDAGSWVIAPPGWEGSVPAGTQLFKAPTSLVFMLGRFLVLNAGDLPSANGVMSHVRLEPLTYGSATPEASSLGSPPGKPQDAADAGAAFFDELGDTLAIAPPTSDVDVEAMRGFAAIGIGPGKHPAADGTAESRAILAQGVVDATDRITDLVAASAISVNGWDSQGQMGTYGDNFPLRAAIASIGWGANVPEEAVYMHSEKDANGQEYSGDHNYVLHFAADQLPPAKAFWSLTLYGPDHFLIDNPARRYAISDRTPGLQFNADGSLDIYFQRSAPAGHESNWVPTPVGSFYLSLRIYLPEQSVLDGTYHPPPVMPQ